MGAYAWGNCCNWRGRGCMGLVGVGVVGVCVGVFVWDRVGDVCACKSAWVRLRLFGRVQKWACTCVGVCARGQRSSVLGCVGV